MDPQDLQQQLAKAKAAMGNSNQTTYPSVLANIRRENLKPDLNLESIANNPAALEKKRVEARRFMESPEQRARRTEREQAEAAKLLTEKKVEELKEARLSLEKKRAAEGTDLAAQEKKAREEAQKLYHQKVEAAKIRINEIAQTPSFSPSNIRTLKTDLLSETADPNFSVAKNLIEQRKNQRLNQPIERATEFNWPVIVMILIFLVFGTAALAGAYYLTTNQTTTVPPLQLGKLVFTDLTTKISIDQKTQDQVVTEINTYKNTNSDTLNSLFLTTSTKNSPDSSGETALTRSDWFTFLGITPPISFTHFLTNDANLGVSNYGTSSIWFIFKTRSYEYTFDSLLREGLTTASALYRPLESPAYLNSLQSAKPHQGIIQNIDVQIWQAASSTVLVYGFVDKETLLMAKNETTFTKLLNSYLNGQ